MAQYAAETKVPPERTRADIAAVLAKYGASAFMFGMQPRRAMIVFELRNRRIKFELELPHESDPEFVRTPGRGQVRSLAARRAACEQAIRQRWRALYLVIKAKLEAVESGISEFDEEFLAHIVLPNGQTVGQFMLPQVDTAYATGEMPALLPPPSC